MLKTTANNTESVVFPILLLLIKFFNLSSIPCVFLHIKVVRERFFLSFLHSVRFFAHCDIAISW